MSGIELSCALIHRGATGELIGATIATNGYIEGTNINVNKGETSGIDFQWAYILDLDDVGAKNFGSLTFDLNAVLLLKNITVQGGSQPYDCAGLFGSKCQTVNPKWRHTLRITWNTPWNVLASLQWRYIGGVKLDTNTSNPVLSNGQIDYFDAALEAVNYLDLAVEWRITHQLTLRVGVNNVFDQDPPVVTSGVAGTGAPNTYPTYDLLGREIFASATARF
jgi:outer membrane receptor protein involved in Fe transport